MNKYFSFKEEASRSEFWGVTLISWAMYCTIVFPIYIALIFGNDVFTNIMVVVVMLGIINILRFWLKISVHARRCNEANISRWWVLPTVIPFFGLIVTIVLGCIPPDPDRVKLKVNDKA